MKGGAGRAIPSPSPARPRLCAEEEHIKTAVSVRFERRWPVAADSPECPAGAGLPALATAPGGVFPCRDGEPRTRRLPERLSREVPDSRQWGNCVLSSAGMIPASHSVQQRNESIVLRASGERTIKRGGTGGVESVTSALFLFLPLKSI